MITESQIRNQIVRRIQKIPSGKLKKLQKFVDELENNTKKKTRTLSYAGSWNDINESVYKNLTTDLIQNRQKNKRRFEE
jgi:hypothetical protein